MSENNDFKQIQKMSQEQVQVQRAHQNQVILGQLIEMNDEEIKDRIELELDDNPALEQANENENNDNYDKNSDDGSDDNDMDSANEDPFESPYAQSDDDYNDSNDDGLAFIQTRRRNSGTSDGYRPPVVNEESMYEVLMNQVRERDLDERQLLIAEYIIGEIDDDGLMRRPIHSICGDIISRENEFVTPQEVQDVLEVIQDLEPAGIGATSTQECILFQIEDMKGVDINAAQVAYKIIKDYFGAYEKHHYDKILNDMGINKDLFERADQIIKRTNPRPGNIFGSGERMGNATHITPDFVINTDNDKLQLTVVNDIPELQISESYELEYRRITNKKNKLMKERDEDVLIKRQYENASNFIKLLKMRQEKLFNIMKAIMLKQQEFFITGDTMTLKPMVLNDIAEATGYDVSTISRAHQNKYVDTNWGIFDLKYFFSKGLDDNDQVSSTAIKETLKQLIDGENKRKPLSDEQLCKALQDKGFPIKRRTVAKYRDSLNIPVARQRKSL
ncbi:MAG: RNA polymerase factor sigma-54 [Muribaculaceae bacterium]|nr:RNA polymerase factor sigma-54 [Muribaculaceae bacterium]